MSNILIACATTANHDNSTMSCFYEGFASSLCRNGNNALVLNSAEFLPCYWNGENDIAPSLDGAKLTKAIVDFKPALTFAFNNSIPDCVVDQLDTPIVVWDADSIGFFNGKQRLRSNASRYHFFCFSRHGMVLANEFGAPEANIYYMPPATDVRSKEHNQLYNVTFIGSLFQNDQRLNNFIESYPSRGERDEIIALVRGGFEQIQHSYIQARKETIEEFLPLNLLFSMFAPSYRIDCLNRLAPLGLHLWGTPDWLEIAKFFPNVALAFNPEKVYSLAHNTSIYNSSKLCLNVPHSQVVDGYPWRVLDIMASNGCLLTSHSTGVSALLEKYVDLPTFGDPESAVELASELLADHKKRNEITAASQRCIDNECRWEARFAEIEKVVGVNLLKRKEAPGLLRLLNPTEFRKTQNARGAPLLTEPAGDLSFYGRSMMWWKRRTKRLAEQVLKP